jgi:hypothetical protein
VKRIGTTPFPQLNSIDISDLKAWCEIEGLTYYLDRSNKTGQGIDLYLCGELQEYLLIPQGVTKINPNVFSNFNFKAISIPDSVVSIGENAFGNCRSSKIIVGRGVCNVGQYAFDSQYLKDICFKTKKDNIEMSDTCFGENSPTIHVDSSDMVS